MALAKNPWLTFEMKLYAQASSGAARASSRAETVHKVGRWIEEAAAEWKGKCKAQRAGGFKATIDYQMVLQSYQRLSIARVLCYISITQSGIERHRSAISVQAIAFMLRLSLPSNTIGSGSVTLELQLFQPLCQASFGLRGTRGAKILPKEISSLQIFIAHIVDDLSFPNANGQRKILSH